MSDIESATYSEAAGGNNAASPNGAPEVMAPSGVNDTIREIMAAIKRDWNRSHPTVTSGGAANAQTLTYAAAPAGYFQGQRFCFIAGFANTGAATLNVNGIGAKNIFMDGVALVGGEIVAGSVVEMVYDGTQFQITSSRAPGAFPGGFKNWLINGDFDVWQRGAGGSAAISATATVPTYVADRWFINSQTNAQTASQQAGLTNGSRFCMRVQRNVGQTGTTATAVGQAFTTDMMVPLRGQIITISAKVRSGANWSPTSGALTMGFATGTGTEQKGTNGFTGIVIVATVTTNLGTSSAVTTVKVTSSAVVPTNATQGELDFVYTPTGTAGANDYFEVDEVQIEIGGIATAFDRRPFLDELARCQRFYWKSFPYGTAPAQNLGFIGQELTFTQAVGAATAFGGPCFMLPVRMRVAGTGVLYNTSATNAQIRDQQIAADCSGSTIAPKEAFFSVNATSAAASVAGNQNAFGATIDAEI
jgi:hypothetical protein